MKKTTALFMSVMLALALSSCKNKSSDALELKFFTLGDIGHVVLEPFYLDEQIVFSAVRREDLRLDSENLYKYEDACLYTIDREKEKLSRHQEFVHDRFFSDEENYYWFNSESDHEQNLMKTGRANKQEDERLATVYGLVAPFGKHKQFIFWGEEKGDSFNLVRINIETLKKDVVLSLPKEHGFIYPEISIYNGYATGYYTDYKKKENFVVVKDIEKEQAEEYTIKLDEPCKNAVSDGKTIYYAKGNQISIHNMETGKEKIVKMRFDNFIDVLNERYLVLTGVEKDNTAIYCYDLEKGKISPIDTGDYIPSSMGTNDDKTELVFVAASKKEPFKPRIGTVKFKD